MAPTILSRNQVSLLLVLAFAGISTLLLESCSNVETSSKSIEASPLKTPLIDTLPDRMNATVANVLKVNFKNADPTVLQKGFFFGGELQESAKVISYKLNDVQFAELFGAMKNSTARELKIRVNVGFRSKDNWNNEEAPNFVPLLEVIGNNQLENTYYPMRPMKTNAILNYCSKFTGLPIDSTQACPLIDQWSSLSVNQVLEQLYAAKATNKTDSLIQYYTFSVGDVNQIRHYRQKQQTEKQACFLYLHLSIHPTDVPLRTILQITDIPLGINGIKESEKPEDDGSGFFEFANPCPHYCDPGDDLSF